MSDYLQLSAMTTVRFAWLLAFSKLTVVAFFATFLVFIARASIRKAGGCDEALAMALTIGSVISFVSMLLASQVGESAAEGALDCRHGDRAVEGWHAILKLGELVGDIHRQQITAGGQRLAEFHEDRPEFLER